MTPAGELVDVAGAGATVDVGFSSFPVLVQILVSTFAVCLTCLAVWARSRRAQMELAARTPPFHGIPLAPGGHWLFGHMRALGGDGDFRRGQHNVMVRPATASSNDGNAEDRGGLCSFWFLSSPALSVLRGPDVRAVLNASSYRQSIGLLKRHNDAFLGPYALTALMGRDWRHYRSAVHRSFTPAALIESQEAINDVGNTLAASLCEAATNYDSHYSTEVLPLMKMATIDVFGRSALGADLGCCSALEPSPVAEAFDYLASEYSRRIRRPLDPCSTLYWIPTPSNRRHTSSRRLIRGYINELIEKGRKDLNEGREGKRNEFLTRLLKANDEKAKDNGQDGSGSGDGDGMSGSILADTLMVLLFGGYDTTSITLTYALYLLATHPRIEEMVMAEIREVMGLPFPWQSGSKSEFESRKDELPNAPTMLDDHAKLPFTRAVILETLRLFPPAPVTTRNLEKSLEIRRGVILPPKTMIYIPIWSIQRDENNYPYPNDFRPDRWVRRMMKKAGGGDGDRDCEIDSSWVERTEEDDDSTNDRGGRDCSTEYVPPANRDAFCAFSGGARNCVGRVLAMQEAVTILACLLRDLRFELARPDDYKLQPVLSSFVQNPHDGLPMVIRPRES